MIAYPKIRVETLAGLMDLELWKESKDALRIVWVKMIAMENRKNEVIGDVESIADVMPKQQPATVAACINRLEERGIVSNIEGGWWLVNDKPHVPVVLSEARKAYLQRQQEESIPDLATAEAPAEPYIQPEFEPEPEPEPKPYPEVEPEPHMPEPVVVTPEPEPEPVVLPPVPAPVSPPVIWLDSKPKLNPQTVRLLEQIAAIEAHSIQHGQWIGTSRDKTRLNILKATIQQIQSQTKPQPRTQPSQQPQVKL